MSASSLNVLGLPLTRSLEWLVSPEALLSSTALSTAQLSSLGPVASLVESTLDGTGSDTPNALVPDSLSAVANGLVLDTHAQLEETGHQVTALNGPLHGLTHLGETLGLGHIGESGNLITDLAGAAGRPTDIGGAAGLLTDAGHVTDAAGTLVQSLTAAPASGNGIVGPNGALDPVTNLLNQGVLDFHTTLEDVGHQNPTLNGPIHGLTGLGETLGLGHIGEPAHLVTDALNLPGGLLGGGGVSAVTPLLSDLADVLTSAGTLVGSLTGAASAGGGLLSPNGLLAPVSNLANAAVLNLHAGIEDVGHDVPLLNDALHGLTNLGETVGLGHLGEAGTLLTDVAGLPGGLLGGDGLGTVAPILGDLGAVTNAAGGLLDGLTGAVGGLGQESGNGGATGGVLAPVTTLLDGATGGTNGDLLGGLLGGSGSGGSGSAHPLIEIGIGPAAANPIADVAVASPQADPSHAIQVGALTAPAGQPGLASINLLEGDSIAFPESGLGGSDALVGKLLDLAPVSSGPGGTEHSGGLSLDLGIASLDLGGHVDTHHADPGGHTSTTGLHLLGL
ncbi:hypothetical protein J2X36_004455 [Methylobacterium sp. BE186]|uniref:hypothetical protein n=1 Tax=Methylobacterium sp. BE186 TaxID=2817715 RepID=UPI002856A26A|nr:hypothetical protein [Methylobacterium sp. BE186]MDR7039678.1 hypothetical protein [Methylobacterium sp. BE186]